MTLMTVNNHNEQDGDHRSQPRWSAGKKTDGPNLRWGTDATMAWTRAGGRVWVFCVVDHYTAEAWAHVAKVGDRFAALQPVYDAVIDRWGRRDAGPGSWPVVAARLGAAVALGALPGLDRLAGHQRRRRLSWVSRRPTAAPNAGSAP
jgi:hypothetical protein